MSLSASAADVRSILSLPETSSTPAPTKKLQPASARKPEGISRELYSLIGPSAPSLAAHLAKPRLKQKPNFGKGGKVKWEWRSFKNAGRKDGLQLYHWVKASTDPDAEYPFAKYNVPSNIYSYDDDEYTRFLGDDEWTKEETDHLFSLVREYDSRWYIIHDRYDFPNGTPRAMEDLRDRYYSSCRKLIRNRPWQGDEASRAQLISTFQFDKEREVMRKKYLASLENRTPEQVAEEEALYVEVKRLEQKERRFKRERDELLRTLAGADSGLPDLPIDEDGLASLSLEVKKKKKGSMMDLDSPSTPSNIIALGPPIPKPRINAAKSAAFDALHFITRTDAPVATTPATKAAHQPVYLRSFKIPAPKATVAPKVSLALAELNISYSRLVMPTRDNCAQLDALVEAATTLVEIKKLVDKVDYDMRVLKARLGARAGEGVDVKPGNGSRVEESVEADGAAKGECDVDTRSLRNKLKLFQTRRSGSASSVDTAGTVSTRAGTKRQKRN